MQSLSRFTLSAAIAALLIAPSAFAQDGDSASGKRFSVVGSATLLQPDSDPQPGARIDADGDVAPTLSATWHVNDNIGVELWGAADKFNHRVRGREGKIGTVEQQPVALSGQYHFGNADAVMRPFLGLGYYESNFSNEDISAGGPHVGLDTTKGAIATAGMDFNISSRWFARADVRYLKGDAGVNVAGESTGDELTIDPWTLGFGVGARF